MKYATVGEVRAYNGWHPIKVSGEVLSRVDGQLFQTLRKPLVDGDNDGVLLDDVGVYLDGEEVGTSSIDPERGFLMLETNPQSDSVVTADYFWHPVGDGEIEMALEAAAHEIESVTGIVFTPHVRGERVKLFHGSELSLSEPVISIQRLRVYDLRGNLLADDAGYEILNRHTGLIRLKDYSAGRPSPPWYLTTPLEVEASYLAGYSELPAQVKQAAILIATYWILLKVDRQIYFGEDYGGGVSASFTSRELGDRLNFLRREIERVKASLPKRVSRA